MYMCRQTCMTKESPPCEFSGALALPRGKTKWKADGMELSCQSYLISTQRTSWNVLGLMIGECAMVVALDCREGQHRGSSTHSCLPYMERRIQGRHLAYCALNLSSPQRGRAEKRDCILFQHSVSQVGLVKYELPILEKRTGSKLSIFVLIWLGLHRNIVLFLPSLEYLMQWNQPCRKSKCNRFVAGYDGIKIGILNVKKIAHVLVHQLHYKTPLKGDPDILWTNCPIQKKKVH